MADLAQHEVWVGGRLIQARRRQDITPGALNVPSVIMKPSKAVSGKKKKAKAGATVSSTSILNIDTSSIITMQDSIMTESKEEDSSIMIQHHNYDADKTVIAKATDFLESHQLQDETDYRRFATSIQLIARADDELILHLDQQRQQQQHSWNGDDIEENHHDAYEERIDPSRQRLMIKSLPIKFLKGKRALGQA